MKENIDVVILGTSFQENELLRISSLSRATGLKMKVITVEVEKELIPSTEAYAQIEIIPNTAHKLDREILKEVNKKTLEKIVSRFSISSLWEIIPEHNNFLLTTLNFPARIYIANDIYVLPSAVISAAYFNSYLIFNLSGLLHNSTACKNIINGELEKIKDLFSVYSDLIINNYDCLSQELLGNVINGNEPFNKTLNNVYREVENKEFETAIRNLNNLAKFHTDNTCVLYNLAALEYSKENYLGALGYIWKILERDFYNKSAALLLRDILKKELNKYSFGNIVENKESKKKILLITNQYFKSADTCSIKQFLSANSSSSVVYYYLNFAYDAFIPQHLINVEYDLIILLPEYFEALNEKNVSYFKISPTFEPFYKDKDVVAILNNNSGSDLINDILIQYGVKCVFKYTDSNNFDEENVYGNGTKIFNIPDLYSRELNEKERSDAVNFILKKSFASINQKNTNSYHSHINSKHDLDLVFNNYEGYLDLLKILSEHAALNNEKNNVDAYSKLSVLIINQLIDNYTKYSKEYYQLKDYYAVIFNTRIALQYENNNGLAALFQIASMIQIGELKEEQKKALPVSYFLNLALNGSMSDLNILIMIGDMFFLTGYYIEAEKVYEKILTSNKSYDALFSLARISKKLGKLKIALLLYTDAVKMEPKNKSAYIELGWIAKEIGEIQLLKSVYNILTEIAPDEPSMIAFKESLG